MRFLLHDEAETELEQAAAYYESCRSGLGIEFAEEVYSTVALASSFPEAGTPLSKSTRRYLVKRFPFGVIYRVKGDLLQIIAIADLRRRPGYWSGRRI